MITITTQTGQIIPAEEVAKAEIQRQIAECKAYLNSTDYIYAKQLETGEAPNAETVAQRMIARSYIRENENKLV